MWKTWLVDLWQWKWAARGLGTDRLGVLSSVAEMLLVLRVCFPGGSAGKESACNAGDLGLIPGLGRSLEKGKATHSSIQAWRIPGTV